MYYYSPSKELEFHLITKKIMKIKRRGTDTRDLISIALGPIAKKIPIKIQHIMLAKKSSPAKMFSSPSSIG